MKKIIITLLIFIGLTISLPVLAITLYDYYIQRQSHFPSIKERAEEYNVYFPDEYKGTAEQNIKFRQLLEGLGNEEVAIGGFTSRGYSTNFLTVATSGPMSVGSDAQILATSSSQRAYVSICNANATDSAILGMNNDRTMATTVSIALNASIFIQPKTCYEIKPENMYEGSIRASSTGATITLIVYEATTNDK